MTRPPPEAISKAELYEFYARGPEAGWAEYLRPDGLPRLRPVRFRMLATLAMVPEGPPPGRLLDLGCGVGILLTQLLKRFPRARGTGADLALPHLTRARALAEAHAVGARAAFVQADLDRLPLAGAVDLVVATEVLEHLLDPAPALGAIRRLLAPGGTLVASVPLRFPGDGVVYRQGEVETGDFGAIDPDRPYERFFHRLYTPALARETFAAAGFRVEAERAASFEFPPAPDWGDRLIRAPWLDRLANWVTGGRWARIGLYRLRAA